MTYSCAIFPELDGDLRPVRSSSHHRDLLTYLECSCIGDGAGEVFMVFSQLSSRFDLLTYTILFTHFFSVF